MSVIGSVKSNGNTYIEIVNGNIDLVEIRNAQNHAERIIIFRSMIPNLIEELKKVPIIDRNKK